MKTKKIEIEIPEGKKAEWVNGVLTLIDEQPKDITERIKTFDDACKWCNENDKTELVAEYDAVNVDSPIAGGKASHDLLAYLKLRIIVAALNEGWEPQFTEDEERWYPWYYLYTEAELAEQSEQWKKSHTILPLGRVVGRSSSSAFARGGLVYAFTNSASSYSSTNSGSRLAFKSESVAEYAGKQFIEIYADFQLIRCENGNEEV